MPNLVNESQILARIDNLATQYFTDSLSSEEQVELLELIRSSETGAKRFAEWETAYACAHIPRFEAERAENLRKVLTTINSKPSARHIPVETKVPRSRPAFFSMVAGIAAAIIVAGGNYFFIHQSGRMRQAEAQITELSVPVGSQLQLTLPDGSLVYLNSGTTLRYGRDFGRKTRSVELNGEAYFEVSRDEKHPFIVRSADLDIRVLGTVFDMRSYPDDPVSSINLISGRVAVTANASNEAVILSPSQCARLDKTTGKLTVLETHTEKSALWRQGVLHFENVSLIRLFADLERQLGIRFVIESHYAVSEYYTGSIDTSLDINEILSGIDVDCKYRWERHGNTIRLKDK